jgi:acyl transferase domain-containing protein
MKQSEIVAELTNLVSLEIDSVEAYHAAVEALGGAGTALGAVLARFEAEHQQHALDLHDVFLRMRVRPPEVTPDVKGVVIGAITEPRRDLTAQEILDAVRGNEQLVRTVYRKAASRKLPADLLALAAASRDEAERHLAWLEEAVARRLWERTAEPVAP